MSSMPSSGSAAGATWSSSSSASGSYFAGRLMTFNMRSRAAERLGELSAQDVDQEKLPETTALRLPPRAFRRPEHLFEFAMKVITVFGRPNAKPVRNDCQVAECCPK